MNKKLFFDANLSYLVKTHSAKWKPLADRSKLLKTILESPNNRLFLDIDERDVADTAQKDNKKTIQDIVCALEISGFSFINLEDKVASKDGKNFTKIGKIFHKEGLFKLEEKWKRFCNDCVMQKDVKLCLSLNPVDILSVSYCRSWTSCLDPDSANYLHLADGIIRSDKFSFVAYLVHSNDVDIQKPIGRRFIHGFICEKSGRLEGKQLDGNLWFYDWKSNQYPSFFFAPDSTYGRFGFKRTLDKFLLEINVELCSQREEIHLCVGYYNDSLNKFFCPRQLSFKNPFSKLEDSTSKNKSNKIKKLCGYDSVLFGKGENVTYPGPYHLNKIVRLRKIKSKKEKDFLVTIWPRLLLYQQARLCELIDMSGFLEEKLVNFDFLLKHGKIAKNEKILEVKKEISKKESDSVRLKKN